jgi:hypothetical protein
MRPVQCVACQGGLPHGSARILATVAAGSGCLPGLRSTASTGQRLLDKRTIRARFSEAGCNNRRSQQSHGIFIAKKHAPRITWLESAVNPMFMSMHYTIAVRRNRIRLQAVQRHRRTTRWASRSASSRRGSSSKWRFPQDCAVRRSRRQPEHRADSRPPSENGPNVPR